MTGANRGAYHDFYWHRHLIVRKNFFHNVQTGVIFVARHTYDEGAPALNVVFQQGTVKASSGNSVVRVRLNTKDADPGYQPGVVMKVNRTVGGVVNVYLVWTGWYTNSANEKYYEFEFRKPASPTFNVDDSVTCNPWFQQSHFQIEDNIFEIGLAPLGYMSITPSGMGSIGPYVADTSVPITPYSQDRVRGVIEDGWLVHLAIIRDNLIRKVENRMDPNQPDQQPQTVSWGIRMNSCENLIVESNVIGQLNNPPLAWNFRPQELAYSDAGTVKSFNNQFNDGKLRQLFNDPSWLGNLRFWVEELETKAEFKYFMF